MANNVVGALDNLFADASDEKKAQYEKVRAYVLPNAVMPGNVLDRPTGDVSTFVEHDEHTFHNLKAQEDILAQVGNPGNPNDFAGGKTEEQMDPEVRAFLGRPVTEKNAEGGSEPLVPAQDDCKEEPKSE